MNTNKPLTLREELALMQKPREAEDSTTLGDLLHKAIDSGYVDRVNNPIDSVIAEHNQLNKQTSNSVMQTVHELFNYAVQRKQKLDNAIDAYLTKLPAADKPTVRYIRSLDMWIQSDSNYGIRGWHRINEAEMPIAIRVGFYADCVE